MGLRHQLTKTALSWPACPWRPCAFAFTLVYGVLFLASGALIPLITDAPMGPGHEGSGHRVGRCGARHRGQSPSPPAAIGRIGSGLHGCRDGHEREELLRATGCDGEAATTGRESTPSIKAQQHTSDLHQLILYSALAVVFMAILAVVLGWLMSGRVLRPLRTITTAARDISDTSLNQRLRLSGPNDELKELGGYVRRIARAPGGIFRLPPPISPPTPPTSCAPRWPPFGRRSMWLSPSLGMGP